MPCPRPVGMRRLLLTVGVLLALPGTAHAFDYGVASGEVRASRAIVWTRADSPGPVTLELRSHGALVRRIGLEATRRTDLTLSVAVGGLRPATRYTFRFRQGREISRLGHLKTAPAANDNRVVRFGWSGDSDGRFIPGTHRRMFGNWPLFNTIASENLDFFVYLGDTIYADHNHVARTLDQYRRKYRWYRSPPMRNLLAHTPVVVQSDDHEVTDNYAGADVNRFQQRNGMKAFHEYWPVRHARGGRLYHTVRYGRNLELFVLDERRYRSSSALGDCTDASGERDWAPLAPEWFRQRYAPFVPSLGRPLSEHCRAALMSPRRTFLGAAQERWLVRSLRRSTATWKVIVSELPVQTYYMNPYDRWDGYPPARDALLRAILHYDVRNVVWLAADQHATMVNDVRLSDGRPTGMKEVVTGPIGAITYAKQIEEIAGPGTGVLVPALLKSLGVSCVNVDEFSYGVVRASRHRLTVDPRDKHRHSICGGPALDLKAR